MSETDGRNGFIEHWKASALSVLGCLVLYVASHAPVVALTVNAQNERPGWVKMFYRPIGMVVKGMPGAFARWYVVYLQWWFYLLNSEPPPRPGTVRTT